MAPSRTEDTYELPVSPDKAANGLNGKRSIAELTEEAPAAPAKKGKYNAIPGPLGLASASLEGKVALVTGAGTFPVASLVLPSILCVFVVQRPVFLSPGFACTVWLRCRTP